MKDLILKYKWVILLLLIGSVAIPLLLGFGRGGEEKNFPSIPIPTQIPSPTPHAIERVKISPLQKTVISQTTDQEVQGKSDLLKTEQLPNSETKYSFKSLLVVKPNEVITKAGSVIFEKIVTPIEQDQEGYVKASSLITQLGQPDDIVNGSHLFGYFYKTYIYARTGVSFMFNVNTDVVFEINLFTPTTVAEYKTNYGQDLNPDAQPPAN